MYADDRKQCSPALFTTLWHQKKMLFPILPTGLTDPLFITTARWQNKSNLIAICLVYLWQKWTKQTGEYACSWFSELPLRPWRPALVYRKLTYIQTNKNKKNTGAHLSNHLTHMHATTHTLVSHNPLFLPTVHVCDNENTRPSYYRWQTTDARHYWGKCSRQQLLLLWVRMSVTEKAPCDTNQTHPQTPDPR